MSALLKKTTCRFLVAAVLAWTPFNAGAQTSKRVLVAVTDTLPAGVVAVVARREAGAHKNVIVLASNNLNPLTLGTAMRLVQRWRTAPPQRDTVVRVMEMEHLELDDVDMSQMRVRLDLLKRAGPAKVPGFGVLNALNIELPRELIGHK